ncbi:MAG: tRNA (5-methylaminomethyl-2-thiouridine)(34)-methyltransferase MnmD [Gelidibacter sp.]|nr:tRNA (5-methylaminomethyl-2-thiouridine)(34)-methyltransferase MnmD [Gelidibacter sp.]
MQRKIITTADGSKTIHIEEWNEHYHSIHGAIQEANHVFIKHGLLFFVEQNPFQKDLSILEIGFGTGLNAFLTLLEAEKLNNCIDYVGVEAYPVKPDEIAALNYVEQLSVEAKAHQFELMHQSTWETKHQIGPLFLLTKQQKFFGDIKQKNTFNLIYFDAFGARVQPELWTEDIFKIMFEALKPKGILVTYSAKGSVRRAMLAVGFSVTKLPGPPGKREMLRAMKH